MDCTKIANKIKQLRLKKTWTQAKLAEKADVDIRSVSRIEILEAKDIKISTILKIASALGVTPNDILIDELVAQDSIIDDTVITLFKSLSKEQRNKVIEYIHFIDDKR